MNYIAEINAFERWLETNSLPIASQLLWYKLMSICNRCGWAEWVTVDNWRLMGLMQIRREATFIDIRNKLVDAGVIVYQKGKKGSPNKYKMISFTFNKEVQTVVNNKNTFNNEVQSEVQSVVNTVVNSEVQTVVNTVDINKHKHKLNINNKKKDSKEKESAKVKHRHGEYKKVYLTDDDFAKLKNLFPETWEDWVRKLDEYKEQTGKTYANDFLTIKNWHRRDTEKAKEVSKPFVYDRDCGGESL